MEEKEAIERLKQNDLTGLEILIDHHYLRAIRTAYLIVLDRNQAEDIVQSCFIKAVEKINLFDESREFGPWFLKSVINRAINIGHEENRFVSLETELNDERLINLCWLPCNELNPEENVLLSELHQTVWNAIGELTPKQRAVIVMRYFLGFNEREMMKRLESPLSSIKWWLHSAKKKLRDFLKIRGIDDCSSE